MTMDDDGKGERVNETLSLFLDTLYWRLTERLTEFISAPLVGEEYSIVGVVRPNVSTARVFVFDGTDLSDAVGIDCPLLDRSGGQIDHFRHIITLRQVVRSIANNAGANTEGKADSHGFRIVNAQSFYEREEKASVALRDAIFGSVASVLHHFSVDPPSRGAQIIYPVGFLTLNSTTVRVYFRDPDDGETSGFDVNIVDAEGGFKVVAGGFLRAHIRELIGTNTLAGREITAHSDEYCIRAYAMPS